ncbi:MAG: VWA domain-containing protein, partial [Dehalococcoidia bacterium]|nr:VWA domain-containing protein [Dehalococcoidia bacterium]
MSSYSYSRWDGSQDLSWLNADELLKEVSEDLLNHGDLARALRRLMQRGLKNPQGDRMKGLQDLMQQLRNKRQEKLNQYDMGSIMDEIREKLDKIVQTEREGIRRRLEEAGGRGTVDRGQGTEDEGRKSDSQPATAETETLATGPLLPQKDPTPDPQRQLLEKIAAKNLEVLDNLPKDSAGQIKELQNFDFLDPNARQQFKELMDMLQKQMMDQYVQNMMQGLQSMTPDQMSAVRQMIQDLNSMLEERMKGGEPDFDSFMKKWGDFFPDNPKNLDELVANMQKRSAQMQSLLDSLPSGQRQAMQELMDSLVQDQSFKDDLGQLAANLESLFPMRQFKRKYPFRGDESIGLEEAMRLMEELQRLDGLEKQMTRAQQGGEVDDIDAREVQDLLGDEAQQTLEQLKRLADMLEEAGYLRMNGDKMELTPRGIRKIGQKALQDIFAKIQKDQFGKHETDWKGTGGERSDETKQYQFGDPFDLHLERTLMNALRREASGTPVKISPDDFEVYETRHFAQSSIVLMLDVSFSMGQSGSFFAAKKVAVALDNLIRSQFPQDALYIVAFSLY